MFAALLVSAALMAQWVPARWATADPASLELLEETPVNCLLLEESHWSAEFGREAARRKIAVLGVLAPGAGPEAVEKAKAAALDGVVIDGPHESAARRALAGAARKAGLAVVELPPRVEMDFASDAPIIGTYQGVWPGVHTTEDGAAKAAPTGAPWIDSNAGFLRFVRAATEAAVWIGNRPPEKEVIPVARYLQAIGDAAMVGARWILALDADLTRRLLAREAEALAAWKKITGTLAFWEKRRAWTLYPPYGGLIVILEASHGALLSGGVLDMIAARHIPVRAVPSEKLDEAHLANARMALTLDPASLPPAKNEILRNFARRGATLLNAPPGWTLPPQRRDQITVDEREVETLDAMWRGVNSVIGRANLGVRLFNVATMRSELLSAPGGGLVLALVNYSDYPVENITIRPLQKYSKATLYRPGRDPVELEIFENGECDIDLVESCAIVRLENPEGSAETAAGHGH